MGCGVLKKRLLSTNNLYPLALFALLIALWQGASSFALVPRFLLPAPLDVLRALAQDRHLLLLHSRTTMTEAVIGLLLSIGFAALLAVVMDAFDPVKRTLYPLLIVTQTIPAIAIAPLLVLWLGYGMTPKIALIFLTCFFPLVISILGGFASVDPDTLGLLRSMGASELQLLWYVKLPSALEDFFSGLRVAASYAIVGAVISEWLGGNEGLGVYMTRVRKSYSFDKMFAVIVVITIVSLLLLALVDWLQTRAMPHKRAR